MLVALNTCYTRTMIYAKNIQRVIAGRETGPDFYIAMVPYDFLLHDILHSHLQQSILYADGDRRSNHLNPVLTGIIRDVVNGVAHVHKRG